MAAPKSRDPQQYQARKRERARALFEETKKAALQAEADRREARRQVSQCYAEHRPAQIKYQRQMKKCNGGAVLPVYPGRKMCLDVKGEMKLVDAA